MWGKLAKILSFLLVLSIVPELALASAASDDGSHSLNLPARKQWENGHGYCGETSVQTDALYYGTYVSQSLARQIAGGEVLLGDNDQKLLKGLKFNYEEWNSDRPAPQYKDYLVWVKKKLSQGFPVILAVYVKGSTDPDYDHIIPAVGFQSQDTVSFHDQDKLMFHDNFSKDLYTRTFGSLWSDRTIGGSAKDDYYVPKDVDYGVAITGIADEHGETRPVSLSVDSWEEPNVSKGEKPKILHASVSVSRLSTGKKYLLLKYTDVSRIPKSNFAAKKRMADQVTSFTASASAMTFQNSFLSDTLAAYRCVEVDS
jgi:hypothetical protein